MRGLVILLVTITACAPRTVPPLDVPFEHADLRTRERITFAVFGDAGTGSAAQYELGQTLASVCEREGCDFVLVLGDNIYDDGVENVVDPQFRSKFEAPYAPLGRIDMWLVPGNHDWRGSVEAQVRYTLESERWRMPGAHYDIPDLPSWLHIYGFDTEEISRTQADEGAAALCHKPGWRFAFGHHPLYSNGEHGGSDEVREHLQPLFSRCDIRVYFSGHDHHQEHLEHDELHQIIQGAGAQTRPVEGASNEEGTQHFATATRGFALVRVSATVLEMRFFDATGRVLYRAF